MRRATIRGRSPLAITGALLVCGALVVGCGGGGDEKSPASKPAKAPSAGSGKRPAATIDMADLRFEPAKQTVKRGTTVTFRNVGKVTHNAKGKGFFSRSVDPGGSYRHTFRKSGEFDYVCTFHPGMVGTLTVRD